MNYISASFVLCHSVFCLQLPGHIAISLKKLFVNRGISLKYKDKVSYVFIQRYRQARYLKINQYISPK